MYSNDEIMQFVNLVAEVVDPDRIILFGSYAYGNPSEKGGAFIDALRRGRIVYERSPQ